MTSIVSIVGVVLNGKENYQEWFRKLKSALVFNDLLDVYKGKKDSDGKEIAQSHLIMRNNMLFGRQKTTRHIH